MSDKLTENDTKKTILGSMHIEEKTLIGFQLACVLKFALTIFGQILAAMRVHQKMFIYK